MLHPSNSTIHNCCASRGGAAYNPPVATPEAAFLPELPRLIEPEMVLSPACIDSWYAAAVSLPPPYCQLVCRPASTQSVNTYSQSSSWRVSVYHTCSSLCSHCACSISSDWARVGSSREPLRDLVISALFHAGNDAPVTTATQPARQLGRHTARTSNRVALDFAGPRRPRVPAVPLTACAIFVDME